MKPILFNTEIVRAIMDGRKGVTRRVVKPQHLRVLDSPYHRKHPETPDITLIEKLCEPPYQPGDILYVRETFRIDYLSNIPGSGRVQYKADGAYTDFRFAQERYEMMQRAQFKHGWRPNENMPKEAARLFLRVTKVRVEQLQDITEEQAAREGAPKAFEYNLPEGSPESSVIVLDEDGYFALGFKALWDSTVKKADLTRYGWDANPWVWVIEFERCEKPEEDKP